MSRAGTHRGAMGSYRTHVPDLAAREGREQDGLRRYPSCAHACSGNAHRCAVGIYRAYPPYQTCTAITSVGANGTLESYWRR